MLLPEAYTDVARRRVSNVKKMEINFMVESCGLCVFRNVENLFFTYKSIF